MRQANIFFLALSVYLETTAIATAFEFPSVPTFFKPPPVTTVPTATVSLERKKAELLGAISNTQKGKTATLETQAQVLTIVRELEKNAPVPDDLLKNADKAKALDGTWYLQYTSPSDIGDIGGSVDDKWKPLEAPQDGFVETKQFTAKGTVSAAGLTVDTSNRTTKQVFDVEKSTVRNEVNADFGKTIVGGPFRLSKDVPNRAIVEFEDLVIEFNGGMKLNLGWVFSLISKFRGGVGGWLETTYLDEDMRIGRGNKGTMFVLTRDPDVVRP